MRGLLTVIALAAALVPACTASSGRDGLEKVVFKAVKGLGVEGRAPVNEILDLDLPPINNLSNSTVELRSVQLVSPPTAVRVVNVRAYLWQQVGVAWLESAFGDLPKQCPRIHASSSDSGRDEAAIELPMISRLPTSEPFMLSIMHEPAVIVAGRFACRLARDWPKPAPRSRLHRSAAQT